MSNIRVFFALWLNAAERNQMATWQLTLKYLCGGRAMCGETLHSTLLFIGDVASQRLPALQLGVREIIASDFELCFDEARYWKHNHIVYAAPSAIPPPLIALVSALEQRLKALHFKFDQRDYHPHITLLRNAQLCEHPLPVMQPVYWKIRDFALVQSVPHDGLADYRVLARFPLCARSE